MSDLNNLNFIFPVLRRWSRVSENCLQLPSLNKHKEFYLCFEVKIRNPSTFLELLSLKSQIFFFLKTSYFILTEVTDNWFGTHKHLNRSTANKGS